MESKNQSISIPVSGVIFFSILLVAVSVFAGISWNKNKTGQVAGSTNQTTKVTFNPVKTDKPTLDFYVMSFCPYGNEMENILKPNFDLFKDKVDLVPHYIFDKIDDLAASCSKARMGDPAQCPLYVQNKYFPNESECKKTIAQNTSKCLDESGYIKANNVYYSSLHGRSEANQNIREICAYNQVSDKKQWWDFVDNVNKNCTNDNVDSCWEEQAKKANLDTAKITECFNKEAVTLIEKELALTNQYGVQGSPTVLINGVKFPPESAYTEDGKDGLTVGKKIIQVSKLRTPDSLKEGLCASFNKSPDECKTVLSEISTNNAAASGSCN